MDAMIDQARQTPWKAINELRRYLMLPVVRAYFALKGVAWGRGWMIYGLPLIQRHAGSSISIGPGCNLRSWLGSNPLGVRHRCILATWAAGSRISIGADVGMTGGAIVAQTAVTIGDRVFIGANSTITDTDFHPLDPDIRRARPTDGASRPVVIEDDAFIGMHTLILKGAHIGRGAVVGAGSVVHGHVPAGEIYAGNPAVFVRRVRED
jgi:acetyltransferase-like isoleucine patch superfamily enzyme